MVDCLMAYRHDTIGCGSDWFMYEAMVAQGNDARLLSFSGGKHSNPANEWAWIAGCLGIADTCTTACTTLFTQCVSSRASDSTAGPDNFKACETQLKAGQLVDCTVGCAPSLAMLRLSENATVTLSEGKFGTSEPAGVGKHIGSAPMPGCNVPFGEITMGPKAACELPNGYAPPGSVDKSSTGSSGTATAATAATTAPPPTTCVTTCSDEFQRCAKFHKEKKGEENPYQICRAELETGTHIAFSRVKCVPGCLDTNTMAAWKVQASTTEPVKTGGCKEDNDCPGTNRRWRRGIRAV